MGTSFTGSPVHRFISFTIAILAAVPALFAGAQLAPIPAKLVVLTFDDSKASHYTVVRPLLKKYGFGATFFITEGFTFRTKKEDYLTWEQIAELHRDGFEIGNHTRDHMGLSKANLPRVKEQVDAINAQCAAHGIPAPTSFAYPGNTIDPGAIPILAELGFRFARRGGAPDTPTTKATASPTSRAAIIPCFSHRQGTPVRSGPSRTSSARPAKRRTGRSRSCSFTARRTSSTRGSTRPPSDSKRYHEVPPGGRVQGDCSS